MGLREMAENTALNDAVRDVLEHQGRVLLDDPQRCEQALTDSKLSPEDVAGLMAAVAAGVPKRLMRTVPARITSDTVTGLAHGLTGTAGLSPEIARQSVEAWAHGLRIAIEAPAVAAPETAAAKSPKGGAAKTETFSPQATTTEPQPTPPPPKDIPPALPKPPVNITTALLVPVAAIAGGLIGLLGFGIYYAVVLIALNFVFQHHIGPRELGEITGRTMVIVGFPCGVLAGISWLELRRKFDWLGWTVAAVVALVLAVFPFVNGIAPIFGIWVQFGAFGIVGLFAVFGIAAKFDKLSPKKY